MLPDLEKILRADRMARAAVTQAQKQAQALQDQAQEKIQAIKANFQSELAQLKKTAQDEILQQAEARAAAERSATERYIQALREKQKLQGEEAVGFLVTQVLAG